MTNYSIIKKINKLVNKDDIVIFLGESLSKVAFNFDNKNFIYINNDSINFAFLFGILDNINNRVFVFCESDFVVKYFNSFIEINKHYRNRKLFIFVLRDKVCDNVFNCISHPQASFLNIGFKSYKATPYFNSVDDCIKLKAFMDSSIYTSVFLVEFDSDVFAKYMVDLHVGYSIKQNINEFIADSNKE
jgi:hypothetical protein